MNDPLYQAVRANMVRASDLQQMVFPPPQSYIDGIIMEGLTILGGKPKLGKSWFVLRATLTIATGGIAFGNSSRAVTPARCLFLALEDGQRRLQSRLTALSPPGDDWPADLMMVTSWPRLDEGGVELLRDVTDIDGYRVVVIDTLGKVRSPRRGKDGYQEDSDALSQLHDLTRERPGLAIVLIHHNRKDDHPDDYIDALSGTTGLTGVVDHIAVLQRGRGDADAVLRFTSRDAADHDTAFGFSAGAWTELGSAAEHDLSKARKAVLQAVTDMESATLTEIANEVKRPPGNTSKLLRALESEGLVRQDEKRGPWRLTGNAEKTDNSDNSDAQPLLSVVSDLFESEETT